MPIFLRPGRRGRNPRIDNKPDSTHPGRRALALPGMDRVSRRLGQRLKVLRGRAGVSASRARMNFKRPLHRLQPKGNPLLGQVEFFGAPTSAPSLNDGLSAGPTFNPDFDLQTTQPAGDLLADFFREP